MEKAPLNINAMQAISVKSYTLNKILVEVGPTGIKNESHLVKKLVTCGY